MASPAKSITFRLDTGICFTLSLRGVVEVTQSYVGQESNVRLAFNGAEYEFRTVHTLFRAISAFEGTSKTLELEAVQ